MTAQWHGVLAYEDVETVDGRKIATGGLHWPESVLPLVALPTPAEGGGHVGTQLVGRIDRVWREDGEIRGEGVLDEEGDLFAEVAAELAEGEIPGGIDLHNILIEDNDQDILFFTYGDLAAFTIYLNGSSESSFAEGTWISEGPWPE